MRTKLICAAVAATLVSTGAGAQTAVFTGGGATPTTGFTVIDKFNNTNGVTTGLNFQTQLPPANGTGAPPASSIPSGTSYLSVLGGGFATYSLASLLPSAIQFDWGSLDAYNTLTIATTAGSFIYVPGNTGTGGAQMFPGTTDADGNQTQPDTNGRFTFTAALGQRVTGLTFASSANSFEVDNLAVSGAVPEPASWALMISGFGLVGFAMRRRKSSVAFA